MMRQTQTTTMKKLSNIQSVIFILGGLLMVAGAGCYVVGWLQAVVCWVFLAGALMFSTMQSMQTYEGQNTTIARLKKIMNVADIFFILSGMLMVDSAFHFLSTLFTTWEAYIEYVYNKWVLLLLVAAMLEMYTMHRIASELKKEETKE